MATRALRPDARTNVKARSSVLRRGRGRKERTAQAARMIVKLHRRALNELAKY